MPGSLRNRDTGSSRRQSSQCYIPRASPLGSLGWEGRLPPGLRCQLPPLSLLRSHCPSATPAGGLPAPHAVRDWSSPTPLR